MRTATTFYIFSGVGNIFKFLINLLSLEIHGRNGKWEIFWRKEESKLKKNKTNEDENENSQLFM